MIKPILTVSAACAEDAARIAATMASIILRMIFLPVAVPKRDGFLNNMLASFRVRVTEL